MKDFLCPQCGAALKFTSAYSVSTVCEYCRSLVVRHDLNLDLIGKEAVLKDDMNPIQVGTRGAFLGTGFTVVGGVRLNHHEGFWTEWFLHLDKTIQNSRFGWLAQAQGEYQFLFEPIELQNIKREDFRVGEVVAFSSVVDKKLQQWTKSLVGNKDAFQIIDARSAQMTHFLGELPWAPDKARSRTIAELASADDVKLTIEYAEPNALLYFGRVMNFEDFKFQNLKAVTGW